MQPVVSSSLVAYVYLYTSHPHNIELQPKGKYAAYPIKQPVNKTIEMFNTATD